jgi:3',5'-cyclic-nucleotide phosphodiesterase
MRIELLPSSIPASEPQFLVTFLVNDVVAIDGGSVGLMADLRRQRRVRHVFVTHEHLDHVASLPILLENVYEPGPDSVELLASAETLDFLHCDIFNGRVWPDFFELSRPDDPFVRAETLVPLVPVERAGLTITPVPVSHGTPTLGLIVDDGTSAVAFPSDTGPTEAIWERLAGVKNLRAVFLETSFPDEYRDLAADTGHHCPATFAAEIRKLPRDVRWIVVHRKARFMAEIAREIEALKLPNVEFVRPGFVYEW